MTDYIVQEPGQTKSVLFGPADQVGVLLTSLGDGMVLSVYIDKDGMEPEGFQLTVTPQAVGMDVFGGEVVDLDDLLGSITKES